MTNTSEAIKELVNCKHELERHIQVIISAEVDAFYDKFGVGIRSISITMIDA
jgi:hypothetical protein